jgi:uncharacterized protein YegP (UPF0339 family)
MSEGREPRVIGYPDKAGEYRWRLIGGNGEIQATGEGFETEEHAQESVDRVAANFGAVSGLTGAAGLAESEVHVPIEWITTKEAMDYDEGLRI